MFGVNSAEDIVFACQNTICVSLLHRTGEKEELRTYARDQHDYLEYYPFVEISTWLLWDGQLVFYGEKDAKFMRASFPQDAEPWAMYAYPDDREKELARDVVAVYIGTSRSEYRVNKMFFLLAEPAAEGKISKDWSWDRRDRV
jgi:hypothetical protein